MSQQRSKQTISASHALWPVWAICALLVLGMIAIYVGVSLSERPKASDIPVLDVPETSEIVLHTADFGLGQLRLFHVAGTGITFAVKRLSDRHVRASLSSCTVCSRQGHKSYAKKNELFCGVCNQTMRFQNDTSVQKSVNGHCPLPEIPVSEKDGEITIALKDLVRVADQALMK